VALSIDIPGRDPLDLEHLVLDVNGTLTARGELIEGVRVRLEQLRTTLELHVLSADTFGTLATVTEELGVQAQTVATGADKARVVVGLGAERCIAIGNGANDGPMLERAALGIAVIGPEGAAPSAVGAADVVCTSIVDALDLLLDTRAVVATLRQ
jgi:P-type E1-E2 ATPase